MAELFRSGNYDQMPQIYIYIYVQSSSGFSDLQRRVLASFFGSQAPQNCWEESDRSIVGDTLR